MTKIYQLGSLEVSYKSQDLAIKFGNVRYSQL